MKPHRCFLFSLAFLLAGLCESSAQGFHWSYRTRITQAFDSAPGQKVPAAPAPEFVPYPLYPWEMVRAGIGGSATVQFRVTAEGRVEELSVVKATHEAFSRTALEAVKSWRFLPLSKNALGYPSSVVVICTFKFEMPEE